MRQDHYSILEVSPRACEEVIHSSYRALAKLHHANDTRLRAINEAKRVLLDATLRKEYDAKANQGKMIGPYKVIREIAEGGFGKTYYGEHVMLGTPVCIKHASNVSAQDEELMLAEAATIWDLRHFSIPAIRDIIKLPNGSMAVIMSYVPGMTLGELVEAMAAKKRRLDPEDVAWITERILGVLRYLHYHGVVHGDVKPQNIIVQHDKHQIVLVDYGLSLLRPTANTINKGYTPYFAPPEQVAGSTLIPESDFFGLGMTMIFAFGGDVTSKDIPSNIPDPICEFIRKLIRFNVLERPNWHKEDLIETLQAIRKKAFGRTASGMKPLNL